MKKIKVLMIGDYPLGNIYGGVQMHTYQLAQHLKSLDNVELHILKLGTESEHFIKDDIYFHLVSKFPFRYFRPFDILKIKNEILKIDPDIVHVQGTHFLDTFPAIFTQSIYPTVLTVHGLNEIECKFENGINYFLTSTIGIPTEKYAISKIQNIIVCSPSMKSLVSEMTNSFIYVIPNGINLEGANNIQPINLRHPNIFFIGRLHKVKGVEVLLRAIPIILNKIPDICVYIAGSGPYDSTLKKLVYELNIQSNVIFVGFLSEHSKYSYFKSADVCVFPSFYEPFGIMLLEAMACGSPVIASNIGGIPSVVESNKTGLLFECGNIEDLAEKVIILLKDNELQNKMRIEGIKRSKKFTWDLIATSTVEIYQKIIARGRSY